MGSCGFVQLTRIRPGGSCVHPVSLGSLGFTLGVVGFIRGRCIHSGSPIVSLGSSGVVGFTRIRPRGRWIYPASLGSLGFALDIAGFIGGH